MEREQKKEGILHMTDRDICRYLELVDRKLYIITHSGIDWDPAYEKEMEEIDQELAELRAVINQEHEKREGIQKKS